MKRKKWQFWLIMSVVALTVYNILPTVFYYAQPLSGPIESKQASNVAVSIMNRVNQLESDSVDWVRSFAKLIGVSPIDATVTPKSPQTIAVKFSSQVEADRFAKLLPRAGNLIPFYPAQLSVENRDVSSTILEEEGTANVVYLQRNVPIHFDTDHAENYFSYGKMYQDNGTMTDAYWTVIRDRLSQIALAVGGPTEQSGLVDLAINNKSDPRSRDFSYMIAQEIVRIQQLFEGAPELRDRFFAAFTQGHFANKAQTVEQILETLTLAKDRFVSERISLQDEGKTKEVLADELESSNLRAKEATLLKALSIIKRNKQAFASGVMPWTSMEVMNLLIDRSPSLAHSLPVGFHNPIIQSIDLDPQELTISLTVNPDFLAFREAIAAKGNQEGKIESINQLLYDEMAKISRDSDEKAIPNGPKYVIQLREIPHASSFLQMDLSAIAKAQFNRILNLLNNDWKRISSDFNQEAYPVIEWSRFHALPETEQHLQLVVYAPNLEKGTPLQGFKNNSIYVIAKDFTKIAAKFNEGRSSGAQLASEDFQNLVGLLRAQGFIGYPGTTYPLPPEYANDYIFEISDYYLPLLQATREHFTTHGTKKYAILEFSDLKERILTLNRIETQMHEDLLKWRDEYLAAKMDPTGQTRYDVPKPTKNALWNNLSLSFAKYFRGDERKILQWGLDLSGGKTVQIALKDSNGKAVTSEADLRQGINELYNRVNKMGVSDVSIRLEGTNITLDFPGSGDISAAQLVKASSMTFNIVNEKFTPNNTSLAGEVNRFLQEVWNEAVVTNKKDVESVNLIAWKHLYGDNLTGEFAAPRSDAAKALYENGLRFANPNDPQISVEFDDISSRIGLYRGDNFADWHGQSHPLVVLFKNFALEGSNLQNIRGSYDPAKGNFLSFEIKNSETLPSGRKITPRKDLYRWTSVFSKESVVGSQYEVYSRGAGWRMAVVLNGYVVSIPHLESPLKDSGTITGHFTQREINQLTADLQAGSLTFTPQILSEKSVSPELGVKERYQGIAATAIALIAVIVIMIAYYRFAGIVASVAVVFNLFIIWATLQNIGASISLAELAGIILTVGMAVDANVLVFERVREEFAKSNKLGSAIAAGYRRAFSAIVDSNVTTIIAALILLHFDSGPIKGFALSLIIGIVSSMFTALFMTKYFFSRWVQNPKHTQLKMANLIRPKNWNFFRFSKLTMLISVILIVSGGVALVKDRNTIFGMDFTGGYAVNLEVQTSPEGQYKERIEKALIAAGAKSSDIHVRELVPTNHLRIFLSTSMAENGHPFYNLPIQTEMENLEYPYQSNPRLVWVVNALASQGIAIQEKSLAELDQNWKSISGQMSSAMRNQALMGLALAMVCILVYITVRFEFTYAISATLCLAFDVLITIALLALLHLIGVNVQIDLHTIAALMTIVGYSLNDTIIVFDRIREDLKIMKREPFKEVVNHAINVTLSRTIMTSGITLVVLLSLVLFGGSSIFGFSLIMSIGVFVGTLSTFFVATALLTYFQGKQRKNHNDHKTVALNGSS